MTLRRLKMLAGVLVLSNFLLGAFSVYLMHRTDREYSVLIGQSVPALYQGRHVGQQAGVVYRSVVAALLTRDADARTAALARARAALAQGKDLRGKLLRLELLRDHPDLSQDLDQAGTSFGQAAAELLSRITPDDTADAERDRLQVLQGLYELQIASLEKIATVAAGRAEVGSDDTDAQVKVRSELVLGLASWPLIVAALIFGITLVVVVIMLVVFRQAVISDDP